MTQFICMQVIQAASVAMPGKKATRGKQGGWGVMGKYDGCEIEVIKWDLYNPRTDSKKPTWFRFENSIATGPAFFSLDCEQKWLWVVILSLVSQANGEKIVWNSAYIQSITKIKPIKQDQTIELFEKFVRLRVSRKVTSRDPHVENEVTQRDSPATNERTNETNEHEQHFDFESIYRKYPRKVGKSEGIKKAERDVKSAEEFAALSKAVDAYSRYVKAKTLEEKYIKHFSSFMSSWRDWCDPDAGKVKVVVPEPPREPKWFEKPFEDPDPDEVTRTCDEQFGPYGGDAA